MDVIEAVEQLFTAPHKMSLQDLWTADNAMTQALDGPIEQPVLFDRYLWKGYVEITKKARKGDKMSTGAECVYLKTDKGWYYLVQQWPYGEFTEYHAHGPFTEKEDAYKDRRYRYANPGGHQTIFPGQQGYNFWKNKVEESL